MQNNQNSNNYSYQTLNNQQATTGVPLNTYNNQQQQQVINYSNNTTEIQNTEISMNSKEFQMERTKIINFAFGFSIFSTISYIISYLVVIFVVQYLWWYASGFLFFSIIISIIGIIGFRKNAKSHQLAMVFAITWIVNIITQFGMFLFLIMIGEFDVKINYTDEWGWDDYYWEYQTGLVVGLSIYFFIGVLSSVMFYIAANSIRIQYNNFKLKELGLIQGEKSLIMGKPYEQQQQFNYQPPQNFVVQQQQYGQPIEGIKV